MKTIWVTAMILLTALALRAQTNVPVRLALLAETPDAITPADLLTAELSSHTNLQLLERNEINRVYREQGMSAGNTDYLKLGQVLGADGLLLLQTTMEDTNEFLSLRLVAVKPGVVLIAEKFPWPPAALADWAAALMARLEPSFPKLTVMVKDAMPVSVVNFRCAIQSPETQDTERQLKLLAIRRLTKERRLFVLERQQLQLLGEEKQLQLDDTAFWNGSYLLEGAVDQNGYSPDTITINARLTPRKGGAPLLLEAAGSRTNLAEVINQLATKVDKALNVQPTVTEWSAAEEAAQFFDEAKWAMKWGLYKEAQEAAESAWALGRQTKETSLLRLQNYVNNAPGWTDWGLNRYSLPEPNPAGLDLAIQALKVFNEGTRWLGQRPEIIGVKPGTRQVRDWQSPASSIFSNNVEWFDLGLRALDLAGAELEDFNGVAEARADQEQNLAKLRDLTRTIAAVLETNVPPEHEARRWMNHNWEQMKWKDGGLWFEHPEEALPFYDKILESGFRIQDDQDPNGAVNNDPNLPRFIAWSWTDRKRIPKLLQQFAANLSASPNRDLRLEGLLYDLILAPCDGSGRLEAAQKELSDQIWEQRRGLFEGSHEAGVLERMAAILRGKYGIPGGNLNQEPLMKLKRRLRHDYLANATAFDQDGFQALFSYGDLYDRHNSCRISKEEVSELVPELGEFRERLHIKKNNGIWLNQVETVLTRANTPKDTVPMAPMATNSANYAPLDRGKPSTVNFTPWTIQLSGINPELPPMVRSMIYRQGKLWTELWCSKQGHDPHDFRAAFAETDLQTGSTKVILFPAGSELPSQSFEVTADSLYAFHGTQLARYRFGPGRWEESHTPLEENPQIMTADGQVYLATHSAILQFSPDKETFQVLASTRRKPALNTVDAAENILRIVPANGGKLVVQTPAQAYMYNGGGWSEIAGYKTDGFNWFVKGQIEFVKDGQPLDPTTPQKSLSAYPDWTWNATPITALKLNVPGGRVLVRPDLMGHWLIPTSCLTTNLEDLRHYVATNLPAFRNP